MYSIELKIKRKNLASEAKDIRSEELKLKAKGLGDGPTYDSIHNHRITVVRQAARSAHLAHAFLVGRDYKTVESNAVLSPNDKEIERLVKKYGHSDYTNEDIIEWMQGEKSPCAKAA